MPRSFELYDGPVGPSKLQSQPFCGEQNEWRVRTTRRAARSCSSCHFSSCNHLPAENNSHGKNVVISETGFTSNQARSLKVLDTKIRFGTDDIGDAINLLSIERDRHSNHFGLSLCQLNVVLLGQIEKIESTVRPGRLFESNFESLLYSIGQADPSSRVCRNEQPRDAVLACKFRSKLEYNVLSRSEAARLVCDIVSD